VNARTAVALGARTARRQDLLAARRWPALFPVGLSAGLGFLLLGSRSLWLDEAVSVSLARLGWGDFAATVAGREANMSLYSLLLKLWVGVFGSSEVAARSLSVVCVAAATYMVFLLGARLFGAWPALAGATLFAANPMVLTVAQTARGYALNLLLAAAGMLLVADAVRRRSAWAAAAASVTLAAGVYVNFLSVLLGLAVALWLAGLPGTLVPRKALLLWGGLFALLVAPLAVRIQTANGAGVGWITQGGAARLVARFNGVVPPAVSLTLAGLAVLLGFGLLVRRHAAEQHWSDGIGVSLVLAWLLVPPLMLAALAVAGKPLLVPRYLVFLVPAVVLAVAGALDRLRDLRPRTATVLLVVVGLAGAGLDLAWYHSGPAEDWRATAATVAAGSAPGDGVVVYPAYARIPLDYYDRSGTDLIWPKTTGLLDTLGPVRADAAVIGGRAGSRDRVWLVVRRDGPAMTQGELDVRAGLTQAGLAGTPEDCRGAVCTSAWQRVRVPATGTVTGTITGRALP
jgi:mannosyltransferase